MKEYINLSQYEKEIFNCIDAELIYYPRKEKVNVLSALLNKWGYKNDKKNL